MMEKLKDPGHAARYLTKALEYGDPANLQGALLDVIQARGGYHVVLQERVERVAVEADVMG